MSCDDDIDNSERTYKNAKLYIQLNDKEEFRNRLKGSYRVLQSTYQKLFLTKAINEEVLSEMMIHTFVEGVSTKCYASNLSLTSNKGNDVKVLALRLAKEGVYLNEVLPEEITLKSKGYVNRGNFIIDEIGTTAAGDQREFEVG